jgi:hypothetical protein
MRSYTAWIAIGIFVSGIVAGFFVWKQSTSGAAAGFSLTTITPTPQNVDTPNIAVLDDYKEYRNQQLGFSVHYPADIPPKEYTDQPPGFTVAFQNGDGTAGFQIYAAPIDGTEITKERFARDEPSGVRKDPEDTSVDGAHALAFHGFDAYIGQTYEVWFIHDGFLYEVSTYKDLEPWLNEIMSPWKFL